MSDENNKQNPKAIRDKLTNLVQVNARDYCIKSKLSKNHVDVERFFDKKELNSFYSDPKKQLIDFNSNINKSDLEYYLENSTNKDEFVNIINREGLAISERKVKMLERDFPAAKEEIIKDYVSRGDQKRKLMKIDQYAHNIFNDTGVWSLFLAHFFLTGPIVSADGSSKTIINAPLFFCAVEIQEISGKLALKKRDSKLYFNEKLLSFLKKELNANWEIKDLLEKKNLNEIIAILGETIKRKIRIYTDPAPVDINRKLSQQTEMEVFNNSVLGIYEPSGGKLKADLEVLVNENIDPFARDNKISDKKFIEDEVAGSNLIEITQPLNIYQRYSVRSSLMQDTVIYGPPGTGKSEVISNIIANAIVGQKSVLVVSEKKAALDVLHDRLGAINSLAIFLYDLDDKESFYKKIAEVGEKVGMFWTEDSHRENVNIAEKVTGEEEYDELLKIQKKLREQISKIVDLYVVKDSRKQNFHEYVQARLEANPQILNEARHENLIPFIEETMERYFITDIEQLFDEIAKYNKFLQKFGLDRPGISEKLKAEKITLTNYQTKNNIIGYIAKNRSTLENRIHAVETFFNKHHLADNKELIKELQADNSLLEDEAQQVANFTVKYKDLMDKGFGTFLVEHHNDLDHFLKSYDLSKAPDFTLNNFLENGTILSVKPFLKKYNVDPDAHEKLGAIRDFLQIKHADQPYIFDLIDNIDVVNAQNIFIYLNSWLMSPYIVELNDANFIFFDTETMAKLRNIRLNEYEFEQLKGVLTYEREILDDNRALIMTNFNDLLRQQRHIDEAVAKRTAEKIEKLYVEYLHWVLQQKTGNDLERLKEVFRISNNEKKILPGIQKFVNEYHDELRLIFPIWISKPELVAEMIPLKPDFFDYGIFDEASQMYVEKAYPLVYRSKISIVAGDDKQLKPSSFFASRFDVQADDYALSDMDQVDSLLDRAKVSLWAAFHLKNHYRSAHKDLIKFSNEYIYDKKLNFASYNGVHGAGIEVRNVNGVWDNINEQEAEEAVKLILENIAKYDKILVVTFGIKQSEYIEDLLLRNHEDDQKVIEKIRDNRLMITNLENVQGNEADLVILSVSYGKGPDGVLLNRYGPLMMYGGANRLNVAITRARKRMIILKSLSSDEMNINVDNTNAVIFKLFINFCDHFVQEDEEVRSIAIPEPKPIHGAIGKLLKKLMYDEDWNFITRENYDIGSEILDFVIIDPESNGVVLALMVSDVFKQLSPQKVLENLDKFYFVEDRGFNTILVEEHEWVANQDQIMNLIKLKLQEEIHKKINR